MVDTPDLGSGGESCGGSSPSARTLFIFKGIVTMKIEILEDKGLEKELRVTIPQDALQQAFEKEAEKRQARVKVDGFRPGKAPKEIIYKQYGRSFFDSVIKEKLQEVLKNYYKDHPEDKLIDSSFSIENDIDADKLDAGVLFDVTVKIKLFLKPQIPEIKFDEIVLEEPEFSFSDEFVQSEMENFAKSFRTSVPMKEKRKAQEGDTLVYSMEYQVPSGEKRQVAGSFVLGASEFPEEFEKLLLNVEEGHSITERLRVPKNFPDKDLANKKVLFTVSFSEIRETTHHELNEAFLKEKGFEKLEDFRVFFLEKMMQKHVDELSYHYKKVQLQEKMKKNIDFDVPESWVSEQLDVLNRFWEKSFEDASLGDEFLSQHYGISADQKNDFFEKIVLTQVRSEALLEDLCQKRGVFLTEKERKAVVNNFLEKTGVDVEVLRQIISEHPNFFDDTFRDHKHSKLLNQLLPLCAIEKKKWDFEEFRKSWISIDESLKKENLTSEDFQEMVYKVIKDSKSEEEGVIEGESVEPQ
jgi:trigger factor